MAILPRYQRTGVRIAAPRELDFANLRESARLGQTVSQTVDRMSEFVYKMGADKAQRQGQSAVMERGAQTVLGDIAKKGGPVSIAERAAYELGNRVVSAEMQTSADIEISRVLDQAQTNQTPFSVVQQQLADITDGYPAAIAGIDPETATLLRTNIAGSTAKAGARYAEWYSGVQASAQKSRISDAASLSANNIKANAVVPGTTVDFIKADIQINAEKLAALGMDERAIQVWQQSTYTEALKENYTYKFVNGNLDLKRSIIERLDKAPLPGLDYTETQSFKKSLSAELNASIAIAKGQASDVKDAIGDQEKILTGGGMPDPEVIAGLVTQVDNLGEFGIASQQALVGLADKMQL